MLRHSLLLIFRNFLRFKSTFFINLIGLSTGLACTLLIYLWVSDELATDKFHEHDSRLYHVMEFRVKAGGIWTSPTTSGPMAQILADDLPEIEYTAVSSWPTYMTLTVGDTNLKITGRYTGKDFLKMFSYDVVQGNKATLLDDKKSIVISEGLAGKLFGATQNVLGKTIEVDHEKQYQVTGVIGDVSPHSSEQFECILPFEAFAEGREYLTTFNSTSVMTFAMLKPGVDADAFNQKIAGLVKAKTENQITHRTPFLKKYSDRYLYGQYDNGVLTGGRITYVKLFSIIAVFILLIACINFMNLSTAKASRRIKEVGIKKAIGARRGTLVMQYLGESVMMSMVSLVLAVGIVDVLLPAFNNITAKQLTLDFDLLFILAAVGVTLLTGILAGSYPALFLSRFNPAMVLKGKFNSSFGELWARKGLVVFQFTLSVIFIVSVVVVYKQIQFVQSVNLGYSRDNIVLIDREGGLWKEGALETFINEANTIPGIVKASSISHDMTGHNGGTFGVEWPGKNPDDHTEFEVFTVNYDMMEMLNLEMAEGRMFSRSLATDSSSIVFNENAVAFMGLKDPIGKTVKLWGKDMQIVGVVKDFHYESLHEPLKPLFFRLQPDDTYVVMAKIAPGAEKEALAGLQTLYQKANPGFSFDYTFLDADYQSQYAAEQRIATLSKYFAGLAILISCLGLFGLASFTAERRRKEIGIRKALGSTEAGIVYLLSSEFTKIVFVAVVIALPLSYFLCTYWLKGFAFRIGLQWWYFAAAGVSALLIAWITVGTQAFRAARINPSDCLNEE